MTIPRLIHVIWIGDASRRPDNCINTWRQCNPTFEVKVWGNEELLQNRWINAAHMRSLSQKHLAGVADMMRYEILYRHGGITVDADSVCTRALPNWLLETNDFASWENEHLRPGLLSVAVMGAHPESPLFRELILEIAGTQNVTHSLPWITTGPLVLTRVWRRTRYPLTIHPSHYFTPNHFDGEAYSGSGPRFARQLWTSTRASIEERGELFPQHIEQAG